MSPTNLCAQFRGLSVAGALAAMGLAVGCITSPAESAPAEPAPWSQADARLQAAHPDGRFLTPQIGEAVLAIQQGPMVEEDYEAALGSLEALLAGTDPSPYEFGIILLLSGNCRYNLDDHEGAIADWTRAIEEGDLPEAERQNLLHNIAQLRFADEGYHDAIELMNQWAARGGVMTDRDHFNLFAAQMELGDANGALAHARAAFDVAEEREKRHFDALALALSESGRTEEAAQVRAEAENLFSE